MPSVIPLLKKVQTMTAHFKAPSSKPILSVDGDEHLLCRVCKDYNVHLVAVEILLGHWTVVCLGDTPFVTPIVEPYDRRGSQISIWYRCENGHLFSVSQTFYKGNIQVRTTNYPPNVQVVPSHVDELWRN
jgi:hypothetical protein